MHVVRFAENTEDRRRFTGGQTLQRYGVGDHDRIFDRGRMLLGNAAIGAGSLNSST
jgi:hypothetical protein